MATVIGRRGSSDDIPVITTEDPALSGIVDQFGGVAPGDRARAVAQAKANPKRERGPVTHPDDTPSVDQPSKRTSTITPKDQTIPVQTEATVPQTAVVTMKSEAVPRPKRIPVVLESIAMGKLRIKADFVSVSQTVIALGYIDDDDAVIIEPPPCDSDNPLTVLVEEKTYACISANWTFTTQSVWKVLWVVLVRING